MQQNTNGTTMTDAPIITVGVKLFVGGAAGQSAGKIFYQALKEAGVAVDTPWVIDWDPDVLTNMPKEWAVWRVNPTGIGTRQFHNLYDSLGFDRDVLPSDNARKQKPADYPPIFRTLLTHLEKKMWRVFMNEVEAFARKVDHIVFLFVYCPDGPTSGVTGIEMGLATRKWVSDELEGQNPQPMFASARNRQFSWIGVELNPYDPQEEGDVINWLCGAVRREEILEMIKRGDSPFDTIFVSDPAPLRPFVSERGSVSNETLDTITGEAVAKCLSRWFRPDPQEILDPNRLLSLMNGVPRWEMGFLRIGFTKEDLRTISSLYKARQACRSNNMEALESTLSENWEVLVTNLPEELKERLIKRWRAWDYAKKLGLFARGRGEKRENARDAFFEEIYSVTNDYKNRFEAPRPYHLYPNLDGIADEVLINSIDSPLEEVLGDRHDVIRNVHEGIQSHIKDHHFLRIGEGQEPFERILVLGAGSKGNWETYVGDLDSILEDELLSEGERSRIDVEHHHPEGINEGWYAELVAFAGPAGLDDLGHSARYRRELSSVDDFQKKRYSAFTEHAARITPSSPPSLSEKEGAVGGQVEHSLDEESTKQSRNGNSKRLPEKVEP